MPVLRPPGPAGLRALSAAAAALAVFAFGVWLLSPRFALDAPSLVDDWSAVVRGGDQVAALARLDNPEEQRFRPAWIVWNYLQWHTFDAPDGLAGPNAWNLARLAVLVAGLSLLVLLALPAPKTRAEAAVQGALAAAPAFLALTIPKFARDLARFGTQEPLLVGGMALGGSLLALAARELLRPGAVRRLRLGLLAAGGGLAWLAGVYQKETSLAALPLLAAASFAARARLRGWPQLSPARRRGLVAVAALIALPLVHVAAVGAVIAARGDLVYGAKPGRGLLHGLDLLYDWSSEVFPPAARRVLVAALVLTALAALVRRRLDALALGALAAGGLSFLLAAQSGLAASRYYLPGYALASVALALGLARLPAAVQAAGLAVLALAFLPAHEARSEVAAWVRQEQTGERLVELLRRLDARGCRVAMAGIDEETAAALAALARPGPITPQGGCGRDVYLVLGSGRDAAALAATCARGALTSLGQPFPLEVSRVELHRCSRLRHGRVHDPTLGTLTAEELVAARQFRPRLPE